MIDGQRVEARMRERKLSNSELARRVGLTPPAIRDIVKGDSYNSRHLHKIARELGTTPAWLTGETDDPLANAPDEPELSRDQRDLVTAFEHLSGADRAALLQIAKTMADKSAPTVHAPKLGYRAQSQTQVRAG